ncbi:unnamed protein product [Absidia cylindrospora]
MSAQPKYLQQKPATDDHKSNTVQQNSLNVDDTEPITAESRYINPKTVTNTRNGSTLLPGSNIDQESQSGKNHSSSKLSKRQDPVENVQSPKGDFPEIQAYYSYYSNFYQTSNLWTPQLIDTVHRGTSTTTDTFTELCAG